MKINHIKKFFLTLFLIAFYGSAAGQIMYKTRYKSAILLEGFGQSPIVSANYEVAPLRYKNGFWTGRIGVGFVPGIKNPPPGFGSGAGFSIPVGASYNFLLNNLKKDLTRRVMNKCKTMPAKYDIEWFLEAGGGYTFVKYKTATDRSFLFSMFGVRSQLVINIPPKPRVVFIRATINPVYYNNKVTLIYKPITGGYRFFGGFAIGTSI